MFFHFINRANIGVVQRGSSLCLPLKTTERLWVVGELVRQQLESYEPAQAEVLRLVNHAHAARAPLLDDAVMGDGLAGEAAGSLRCALALLKSDCPRGHIDRRALQENSCFLLGGHERPDLPLQRFVACMLHRLSPRSFRDRAMPWRCSNRASR